jgi:hypothetical protein
MQVRKTAPIILSHFYTFRQARDKGRESTQKECVRLFSAAGRPGSGCAVPAADPDRPGERIVIVRRAAQPDERHFVHGQPPPQGQRTPVFLVPFYAANRICTKTGSRQT